VTVSGLVTARSTGRALGHRNDKELLAQLTGEATVLPRYAAVAPHAFDSPSLEDVALWLGMATQYDLETLEGQFRFGLAQTTVIRLMHLIEQGANYRIVIADSSPRPVVRRVFAALGATVLNATDFSGIGPQNQLAMAYAYIRGARYFLKIDPEKFGLADADILACIAKELSAGAYDILGVGRSPGIPGAGFSSLPEYQQRTERRMSRMFVDLGLQEDAASGVYGFNRTGMLAWLAFDTDTYGTKWQILWHAQLLALAAGLRVGGILLPFVHPREMVAFEEGELNWDYGEGTERVKYYRGKRDFQEALADVVATFATEVLGVTPQAPDEGYLI
jgi:hypothetical protein